MTDSEKVVLRELVLKAIQYLDINSWEVKNNSWTGDLVYKEKLIDVRPKDLMPMLIEKDFQNSFKFFYRIV